MYVYIIVIYIFNIICTYVWYVCMYVCMYVCTYVCTYVCILYDEQILRKGEQFLASYYTDCLSFLLIRPLVCYCLMQILLLGRYQNLKEKFSSLPADNELCQSFLEISNFFPLLTLHYLNLVLLVKPNSTDLVSLLCLTLQIMCTHIHVCRWRVLCPIVLAAPLQFCYNTAPFSQCVPSITIP